MEIKSLDKIDENVLDKIVELYKDNPQYRVSDERKSISFGKPREYFLFEKRDKSISDKEVEWTFIWIHGDLWQFRYLNTHVGNMQGWVDPLILLNDLLK
ncbi:hypothetical protein PANI_CDS0028 [Maribacter phage Panino]